MKKQRSLEAVLREYWNGAPLFVFGDPLKEWRSEFIRKEIQPFITQDASVYAFPMWYKLHLVLPYDVDVWKKMTASAVRLHQIFYCIVLGVVYVNRHLMNHPNHAVPHDVWEKTLLVPIQKYESMFPGGETEFNAAWRLVSQSPLNSHIVSEGSNWFSDLMKNCQISMNRYPV